MLVATPIPYPPKYLRNEINVNINATVNNTPATFTMLCQRPLLTLTVGQPINTKALRVQWPIEIVACTGTSAFAAHLKEA